MLRVWWTSFSRTTNTIAFTICFSFEVFCTMYYIRLKLVVLIWINMLVVKSKNKL
jgi:hypothetical protein